MVGEHARAEYPMQANSVGEHQPDEDRPQDVLDVGHRPVLVFGRGQPPYFGVFAQQADDDEQRETREVVDYSCGGKRIAGEGVVINPILVGANGVHAITTESSAGHRARPSP